MRDYEKVKNVLHVTISILRRVVFKCKKTCFVQLLAWNFQERSIVSFATP